MTCSSAEKRNAPECWSSRLDGPSWPASDSPASLTDPERDDANASKTCPPRPAFLKAT